VIPKVILAILESFLKKLLRRNAVLGVLEDLGRSLSLGSNASALVLEGDGVHKIKLFLARAKDCLIEQQQLFSLSKKRRLGCSQWLKVCRIGLCCRIPGCGIQA